MQGLHSHHFNFVSRCHPLLPFTLSWRDLEKCCKVNASIFFNIDAEEDEGEQEEQEQEEGPKEASLRMFALKYIKLQGLEATALPWLPHWVYMEASCPLKVQQNLPPSCSRSHKEITLLLPQEGTSIMAFRAWQVLPTRSWVQNRKAMYKGDIGYVEENTESDAIIILVAPHQLPYDLPKESGESMRFDVELARMAGLDLVPILSPSGAEHNFGKSRTLLRFERGTSWAREGHSPMVFSLGDMLEIIAGPFCGETGYLVALHECTIILVVMQPNKTLEHIQVSRFVMQSHVQDHILSLGPEVDEPHLVLPLSEDKALLGDIVQVHHGPHTSLMGKIKWISPEGDTVEVARGQWHHSQGVVKAVDLIKASLDLMCSVDRIQINVPITFCCKIKECFDHGLSKFVATRRAVELQTGMLLDGTLLPLQLQHCLKSLHSWSFITPVVPCNVTPPPSPGLSNAGPSDVWSITPDDIIQTQAPNYGKVPWLFKPEFCNFKSFHLGFNVSVGFTQVSLGKCIVRMVCPDQFVGQNGPAPSGSVCITVTGHNTGLAIQHLTIPAQYLMPVNPTSKNQLCLVLKGPQAGRVIHIMKCQRNSKSVVTEDGTTIPFSDICVTFEYNRM
ncbi:hypothetical protein F5141DRAFT_1067339 [Pisolithus sp. B1]|nr:hypothetical protein F5141DRAFT_1067339 [Pisolithus sp. B1]